MNLFNKIEAVHTNTQGWCSIEKAQTLASIILAARPEISLEIGVFFGRSLLPMALAHQAIGKGRIIAVDPWQATASVQGQVNPADQEYWNRQDMHELAYNTFMTRVNELGLNNVVEVQRKRSDEFEPPEGIGLLSVDGNHGLQAVADIKRYAPKVKPGGYLVADDIHWSGHGVEQAIALLPAMGFVELYRVENTSECWAVFQRCWPNLMT